MPLQAITFWLRGVGTSLVTQKDRPAVTPIASPLLCFAQQIPKAKDNLKAFPWIKKKLLNGYVLVNLDLRMP